MQSFTTPYDHRLIRRYLLAFGTIFDSLEIVRKDETDAEFLQKNVPLQYGPKERWLVRLTQDPDFTQGVAQIVPRMSYEMTGIAYDTTRKLNSLEKLTFADADATKRARLYVGVPYTLNVRLSILTKLQQDAHQLVEQILPFFTPDYTIAIRPLADYPDLVDLIPVTLQSISHSDNYEGDFATRRVIVWDLEFSMKVYFYGPVKSKKKIQEVVVDLFSVASGDLMEIPAVEPRPKVTIDVVANPVSQNVSTVTDITADITITERFDSPSLSHSASPSASKSPSASVSPSASSSVSRSPSASVSPSSV